MQTQAGVEAVFTIIVSVCGSTFPSPKDQSATKITMDQLKFNDNQNISVVNHEIPYSVYSDLFDLSETFSDCPYDFEFSTTSYIGSLWTSF